jgi:hypothetical protein
MMLTFYAISLQNWNWATNWNPNKHEKITNFCVIEER